MTTKNNDAFAVGDINSEARGTAARANGDKACMDLLPLYQINSTFQEMGRAIDHLNKGISISLGDLWWGLGEIQAGRRPFLNAYATIARALLLLNQSKGHVMADWREVCAVWDYGRRKYKAFNWAKGQRWSVPVACAARHLAALYGGEDTDPESGRHHLAHVVCNLQMLVHFMAFYPELNDLPKSEWFRRAEKVDDPRAAPAAKGEVAPLPVTTYRSTFLCGQMIPLKRYTLAMLCELADKHLVTKWDMGDLEREMRLHPLVHQGRLDDGMPFYWRSHNLAGAA